MEISSGPALGPVTIFQVFGPELNRGAGRVIVVAGSPFTFLIFSLFTPIPIMNISTLSINIDIRTPSEEELYEIAQAEKITTVKLVSIIEALRPYFRVTPDPVRAPAPTPLADRLRGVAQFVGQKLGSAATINEAADRLETLEREVAALRSARAPEHLFECETCDIVWEGRVSCPKCLGFGKQVREPASPPEPEPREGEVRCVRCKEVLDTAYFTAGCAGPFCRACRADYLAGVDAPTAEPPAPVQPEGREGEWEIHARYANMERRYWEDRALRAEGAAPPQPHADAGLREKVEEIIKMIRGTYDGDEIADRIIALLRSPASEAPPQDALREALEAARHELTTLHNLTVTDQPDAYEEALREGLDADDARDAQREVSWVTDTSAVVAQIDRALSARPAESEVRDGE